MVVGEQRRTLNPQGWQSWSLKNSGYRVNTTPEVLLESVKWPLELST